MNALSCPLCGNNHEFDECPDKKIPEGLNRSISDLVLNSARYFFWRTTLDAANFFERLPAVWQYLHPGDRSTLLRDATWQLKKEPEHENAPLWQRILDAEAARKLLGGRPEFKGIKDVIVGEEVTLIDTKGKRCQKKVTEVTRYRIKIEGGNSFLRSTGMPSLTQAHQSLNLRRDRIIITRPAHR